MPNRTLVYAGAIFLVLLIIALSRAPTTFQEPRVPDFEIVIPAEEVNVPQGASPHDLAVPDDATPLSDAEQHKVLEEILLQEHVQVASNWTLDKKWIKIDFKGIEAYNPNVLAHPHPLKGFEYLVVAQQKQALSYPDKRPTGFFHEIICSASFDSKNSALTCIGPPQILPAASSITDKCNKKLDAFNYEVGPHDARAFMGPGGRPYMIWGSPSPHACMGMWMQDLSRLYYFDYLAPLDKNAPFFQPTALDRPPPYGALEKNWFAFWDRNDEMYMHYDLYPKRVFAKINATGGIGQDLAPLSRAHDDACMAQHMPKIKHPAHERIHQATNSIMVTLCNYNSPDGTQNNACFETEQNTFILTIFHHKTSFLHDVYEPYVMLMKRTAPFEIHAIGKKSIWINGREKPQGSAEAGFSKSKDQLFYVTSINFRERGKDYHGFLDDDLFLSFGIEDERSGTIDVRVADLVQDLGMCGSG